MRSVFRTDQQIYVTMFSISHHAYCIWKLFQKFSNRILANKVKGQIDFLYNFPSYTEAEKVKKYKSKGSSKFIELGQNL